ncbi:hypothetical protein D9757_013968 [Collybiopsis confluens]|uniref:Uncharacterized protein n=1 Tax=Collybiopsis confluens TaxID=2823264 RepID=A0A8H5CMW1_9AGAR|nr:hypothetical protein D9757_013968 [Collybiopsis confluens]
MAFAPHFPADSSPNMTLDPSGEYSWGELEQILAGSSTAAVIPEQSSPLDYHSDSDANLALKFGASFEPSPFTLGTWEGPFDPNASRSVGPITVTQPRRLLPAHRAVTKIDGFEEAQVRTTPDDNWKLFADLTGCLLRGLYLVVLRARQPPSRPRANARRRELKDAPAHAAGKNPMARSADIL